MQQKQIRTGNGIATTSEMAPCPVNSHNEWDPLEEVIVGSLEGATIPSPHLAVTFNVPRYVAQIFKIVGGWPYPPFLTKPAIRELEGFVRLLELEGITVRRPEPYNFRAKFGNHLWKSRGFCVACPRDGFLIVGDEIIETPMAWRTRQTEPAAYRSLFKEYFLKGARWTSAPKPDLADELFNADYTLPEPHEPMRFVVNEHEPVFDAADFVRCGKDLFVTRSNVTNEMGILWLQRHLGDKYRIHRIESRCRQPMHIDSTFMPLAPGKVLVNPEFLDVDRLPPILKSWDVLVAPKPDPIPNPILSMCSSWLSINVLMLDEKKVVVEASQKSMIKALKDWGFEPIACPFRNYAPFGGSFHCATLDVRRRGALKSYFD